MKCHTVGSIFYAHQVHVDETILFYRRGRMSNGDVVVYYNIVDGLLQL